MTLRILLTGKNGQVGSELARLLPSVGELTAFGRAELDLANPKALRRAIADARPNLIINAAAYTAVDQAEKEEALARAINADAPAVIAEQAKKIGAFLVHYSTDYVFDGSKRSPYAEDDRTNPLSAYGRTKLVGEEAIRSSGVPHLILRTAWVYATSGKNFLLTVLRLASTREELRIVNDQFGAPTPARAIAGATARLVGCTSGVAPSSTTRSSGKADEKLTSTNPAAEPLALLTRNSGTYHLTAAGQATWYEFAVAILDTVKGLAPPAGVGTTGRRPAPPNWLAAATADRPLICKRVIPIATAEYPTPATRPAYSVLSNSRFASTFGFSLPDWRAQLGETVEHSS